MATVISLLSEILILLVIVSVILSYVLDRYHPLRRAVDAIVEPLLMPIRRVVPLVGGLDLSPLVLVILIQVLSGLLIRILR